MAERDWQERQAWLARLCWLVLGLVFVGLGVIGTFVPLMPTTIFMILAAGCFARSSPRLESWLLHHPRFGPSLQAWRRDRSIPRRAKRAACAGMALGFIVFALAALIRMSGWPPPWRFDGVTQANAAMLAPSDIGPKE